MTAAELQDRIFKTIKARSGENGIAEEVANLLGISTDSAYRRMRGEKLISLSELTILCTHYKLSVDQVMNIQSPGILFQGQFLNKHNFRFEDYLGTILKNMTAINACQQKKFYILCKDLPIFHQYHIREIAAFKWFFYLKTYFHFPGFEKKKFRFADHPDELYQLEKQILDLYNQIPCVEVWNYENMNIFLRQLDFYTDAEIFESNEDVYRLYEALEKLWDHLEEQASLGHKFTYGDPKQKPLGEYRMYFNEVLLGDNNILVEMEGRRLAYVPHSTINFMITTDKAFTDNMYDHIHNQMRRSTLISEVSEKERSRFFRIIREKIIARKESLER